MPGPPPPPPNAFGVTKSLAQMHAELMEQHAFSHVYVGPPVSGDLFGGWPMDELVKVVLAGLPLHEQAQAVAELKMKHRIHGNTVVYPMPPNVADQRPYTPEEKLSMRMGWPRLEDGCWAPGFEHVAVHSVAASTLVHVWVITKDGQSVVLEDEAGLFPSDGFVTKLNMIKG